jgi:uncharacterized protein (TIGR02145 family)
MPDPYEPTIQIGNQVWMSKNLKATHYRNGHSIPLTPDPDLWEQKTTGGRCAYDNDESNVDTYGYLYNWYAVNDRRGICPVGWHVPSNDDWNDLEDFITNDGYAGIEGCALKEIGYEHWYDYGNPDYEGLDIYGFTALPGGCRYYGNGYYFMGGYGYFWSSTEGSNDGAWGRGLGYGGSGIYRYYDYKRYGFSVRCIAD